MMLLDEIIQLEKKHDAYYDGWNDEKENALLCSLETIKMDMERNRSDIKQIIIRSFESNLSRFNDPYLGCILVILSDVFSVEVNTVLQQIISEDLLFDNNKIESYQNVKYRLFRMIGTSDEWSPILEDVCFSVSLGYSFEAKVGSAVNEYALNVDDKGELEDCKKYVKRINETPLGSVNEKDMITQTKGGLSLDLGFGCPMGCAYCYRINENSERYRERWLPDFSVSPSEIVERLLLHPWFTPHITPLGIQMSTTEAFHPAIWPSTYEILLKLDEKKLTNRVTIITKNTLDSEKIELLEKLKYIDLDVCVCYSAMSQSVEPTSGKHRLAFLKEIKQKQHISAIGYFRPLISGYNMDEHTVEQVISEYRETGVDTVCVGGLKFSEEHKRNFEDLHIELPNNEFKPNRKYLPKETFEMIQDKFTNVFPKDSMLTRRSSCARVIARGCKIPDYNCHAFFVKQIPGCNTSCKNYMNCIHPLIPSYAQTKAVFDRLFDDELSFRICKQFIVTNKKLSVYERSFVMQNLLVPVICEEDVHDYCI